MAENIKSKSTGELLILFFSTGIPLLEENELLETATEGSNSSSVSSGAGGDTGSATYSETSSKT